MSDLIPVIEPDDFDSATQSGVVLVDFSATWCRPCKMQLPILERLVPIFEGKAKIVKVDVDRAQNIAVRFGVESVPTMVILKDGQKVEQFVGIQEENTLKNALEKAVG